MKKYGFRAASLAVALLISMSFVSCGGGFLGVNLTKEEAGDQVKEKWLKFVDPDAIVFELYLGSTADFSKTMNVSTLAFLAPGAEEVVTYHLAIQGNQKPRESITSFEYRKKTAADGIRLADLDLSKISANVNAAAAMIEEEEYPFDGIGGYRIAFTANPAEAVHSFSLESKAGSEMTTQNGRLATQTNYYEFNFKADAAGEIYYID